MRTSRWLPPRKLQFEPATTWTAVAATAILIVSGSMCAASAPADGGEKTEAKPPAAKCPEPGTTTPTPNPNPAAPTTPSAPAAGAKPAAASSAAKVPARRVAMTTTETLTHTTLKPDLSARSQPKAAATPAAEHPVARAIRTIGECQKSYAGIADYSCTFYKRERINGRMTPLYVMSMKARTSPRSIYFKFESPCKGREAIYVEGRNAGKILAHDVGLTRFLAGTLEIEPTSARAMEDNRHPITDAGIGKLIDTIRRRWELELTPEESLVAFNPDMTIGPRKCLMIESVHPRRQPSFQFHKVRLYIDSEHSLPIRFEGYDWPREEGGEAELVEEYSYIDLKLNVGFDDRDFDPANPRYSFGRF